MICKILQTLSRGKAARPGHTQITIDFLHFSE